MAHSSRLLLVGIACCASGSNPKTLDGDPPPPPPQKAGPASTTTGNGVTGKTPRMVATHYDECPAGGSLEVPIAIEDRAKVARDPPLTAFVVPVAKQANLRSLAGIGVMDEAGRRLPAQLEVLSRWGGAPDDCEHPIRYAYARVSAVPEPGHRVEWKVATGTDAGEMSPLTLETSKSAWIIDTGVARFTVRRDRFEGLSKVELPKDGGGYDLVSQLRRESGQSSFFIDHDGALHRISEAEIWKLELERSGPQVVTVVARGYYPGVAKNRRGKGPNATRGLGITVRLHFYARSSIVRVEQTYYYGAVADWSATGLTNTTVVQRAWMTVPLVEPAEKVYARADEKIYTRDPKEVIQVEQKKRTPDQQALAYAISSGDDDLETGESARHPFLAVTSKRFYAMATIARMAVREPQGFTWSNQLNALDVDFTSAPIQVGAARGIWSVAALDFGRGTPSESRAAALQLFAERPLLGAPTPAYLNTTQTLGPYATQSSGAAGVYEALVRKLHANTIEYLKKVRISGLQIWPDLPSGSCDLEYDCPSWADRYYGGGDNNYWNWSKPGIDEFFRTADDDLIYDFSLGEAMTYVETLAVRPDHHWLGDSSVAGLAPCYGDATGYDSRYVEGTNNRRDRCPADYAYDKTLEVAFLATGDFRFIDFFEEAGAAVVNTFGEPPKIPQPYLELNLSRLSTQRLELLADGAEFGRDPKVGALLRAKLRAYVDHMVGRTLVDGNACEVGGTGHHDVTETGECNSVVAWMMPVGTEWAIRTSQILDHEPLFRWVLRYGVVAAKNHSGAENPAAGRDWRVGYTCRISKKGEAGPCKLWSEGENDARFYPNGALAYLNIFGLVLGADPSDPDHICDWLPGVYRSRIGDLGFGDINGNVWGKGSGQALAFSAEAVAALQTCK